MFYNTSQCQPFRHTPQHWKSFRQVRYMFSFDGVPGPSPIKLAEYSNQQSYYTEWGSLLGVQFLGENSPLPVEERDYAPPRSCYYAVHCLSLLGTHSTCVLGIYPWKSLSAPHNPIPAAGKGSRIVMAWVQPNSRQHHPLEWRLNQICWAGSPAHWRLSYMLGFYQNDARGTVSSQMNIPGCER